jgi:hypothetical protein
MEYQAEFCHRFAQEDLILSGSPDFLFHSSLVLIYKIDHNLFICDCEVIQYFLHLDLNSQDSSWLAKFESLKESYSNCSDENKLWLEEGTKKLDNLVTPNLKFKIDNILRYKYSKI